MTNGVMSASDARKGLNGILERFRREGKLAEPVVFGSHRKPEAVVLPYARYQQMLIDIAHAQDMEIEYPGEARSFTRPVSMGRHVDAVEAMRYLADLDAADIILKMRGEG